MDEEDREWDGEDVARFAEQEADKEDEEPFPDPRVELADCSQHSCAAVCRNAARAMPMLPLPACRQLNLHQDAGADG